MTTERDNKLGALIDQRRKLAAQMADLNLQIAMAVGDRNAAIKHMREMNVQTEARCAAKFARQEVSH